MTEIDTATRILRAAEKLFGEVGFDGVSMRDIARKADVNKALVFYHHDNKANLFRRVLDEFYERQRAVVREVMEEADGESPRAQLKHVTDGYFRFVAEYEDHPQLVHSTLTTNSDHIDVIRQKMVPMLEWFEDLLSELCPEQGPLAARHLFVTLGGATSTYLAYSAGLDEGWDGPMLSDKSLDERRRHVHWLIDTLVDRLEAR